MLVLFAFGVSPNQNQGLATTQSIHNPHVQDMIDQVEPGTIFTLTSGLSGEQPVSIGGEPYTIRTRYALSGTPVKKAAQYLYEYYDDTGLDVTYHDFTYSGKVLSNVVAEKVGTVFPERVYLITSHYDDVPSSPPAPGADDDASGTVGVMMAAEILNQYEFGCTLRFVNFSAEEAGLIGSDRYAKQAYCAGEDLLGVLNLDMIAWNSLDSPAEMDLHHLPSIPGSYEIADLFAQVVEDYSLGVEATFPIPITSASDHASFWRYGFPAILASEDLNDFNPYWHTRGDRLENLPDFDYFTEMVKASIGAFAHMGCLVEDGWGKVSGKVTEKGTLSPIEGASISLFNPEWKYTFSTYTDKDGYYELSALAGTHNLYADGMGYPFTPVAEVNVLLDETVSIEIQMEAIREYATFVPLAENEVPPLPGCP
jgi:hypothetical protein